VLGGDPVQLDGGRALAAAVVAQQGCLAEPGGERSGLVGELAHPGPVAAARGGVAL
jgi:hypothetical protein